MNYNQMDKKYNFLSFNESLIKMHFPSVKEDIESRENFRKRLAVDELVSNYFAIRYLKEKTKRKNESLNLKFNLQKKLINELPFELTKNQYKIINDINNYNNTQYRETVLLQGDVGSGKTIVSLLSILICLILSLKYAEASKLAPLAYFEIVNNILIGYYFFGDFPNKWLWLGLFFIVSSGIYISIREVKKLN